MKPTLFDFNGAEIRVSHNKNGIWFVASDVCRVLEIEHHRDAIAKLDSDERESVLVDTLGGPQQTSVINESGLYSMIFKSRKPQAKDFKKWVTSEVLPTIRKTGSYSTTPPAPALSRKDDLIRELVSISAGEISIDLLGMFKPQGEFGSVAKNGKPRVGFRAAAWVASTKSRLEEAAEINRDLLRIGQLELALGCLTEGGPL